MQYFLERARTQHEALDLVKTKYGDNARVLSFRTVRVGGFLGLFRQEGVEVTGILQPEARAAEKKNTESLEDAKQKIIAQAAEQKRNMSRDDSDEALKSLVAEIRGLHEKVDGVILDARAIANEHDHLTIRRIDALLAMNEFSTNFRKEVIARIRHDFSLDELEDSQEVETRVLEWIGDSVGIWQQSEVVQPRVMVLIGPTGTGKTTTVAKLAALGKVGVHAGSAGMNESKPASVRMITIDNYRIAAREQIETYGTIMDVPVASAENAVELKKCLQLFRDADLILIDTVGKSPHDTPSLGEMQKTLSACSSDAEFHLAISATTKASDFVHILRQFEPFDFKSVILTKMDETRRIGNAISALAERGKSLSYFTIGQKVPLDIEEASVLRLLMTLEGFNVDRERLEKRFGGLRMGESESRLVFNFPSRRDGELTNQAMSWLTKQALSDSLEDDEKLAPKI